MIGVKSSGRGSKLRFEGKNGGTDRRVSVVTRFFRALTLALAVAAAVILVFATDTFADYANGGRTEQAMTLPDAVKVWRQDAWQRDDFLSQVRLGDLYSVNQSLGASETKNASFVDRVEAYVWYYLAFRPGNDYRADNNMAAADTIYNVRNTAIANAEQIYSSLTFEQRLDARARILTILSSRGAEGFLTLGRIHASNTGYDAAPITTAPRKKWVMMCVESNWNRWYGFVFWWVWSKMTSETYPHYPVWKWRLNTQRNLDNAYHPSKCFGARTPPEPDNNNALSVNDSASGGSIYDNAASADTSDGPTALNSNGGQTIDMSGGNSDAVSTVTAGSGDGTTDGSYSSGTYSGNTYNNSAYGNSVSGYYGSGNYNNSYSFGGYYGQSISSVFVTNDAEALTYFLIAQRLGHPLAQAYAAGTRRAIRNNNADPQRIIADAEKRARFWSAPYEYYPGATDKGELHSDESLPSVEERLALRRIDKIPASAIVEALDFRGYKMLPRKCGSPAVCLRRAATQFQTAMNWEPTGYLAPDQIVRLIQMAAVDGDAIAQDRLGIMYAKGIGVPQNFVKAERWFIKAANQRYPNALFNLSVLYQVGPNGVEPDEHKANSYRAQAETAGFPEERCELLDLLKLADTGRDRSNGARR